MFCWTLPFPLNTETKNPPTVYRWISLSFRKPSFVSQEIALYCCWWSRYLVTNFSRELVWQWVSPQGAGQGCSALCLQNPVSERRAQKARGMRSLAENLCTGSCSHCELCALGETGRGRRHLHSSTCQWNKSGALKMQQAPMQSPSSLLGDYRFIFLKESLSGLRTMWMQTQAAI